MNKTNPNIELPDGFSAELPADVAWQHFASIDSTNTYLLNQASPHTQLVSAERQTMGRGRRQQPWRDEGQSALFSLSCSFPRGLDISAWSVRVGMTLAYTLNDLIAYCQPTLQPAMTVQVKWPNDLYIAQAQQWGKCGGILIESTVGKDCRVVTGVGINLSPIKQSVSAEYASAFIDLPIAKKTLIAVLANRLLAAWALFLVNPVVNSVKYQRVDGLLNKRLLVTDLTTGLQTVGVGAGVNRQGHFLLQQVAGSVALTQQQRIRVLDD